MVSKIFVNLPVKDLAKSMAFFKAIGFSFNPQFTDNTAACMVMSDDIYAMLLTHDKVKEFSKKPIADADKAIKAGGTEAYSPKDYGFMFTRSFEDPDGHIWEVFWMDSAQVQKG